MGKIKPFLWYNSNPEEVAKFYTSIIKNSRIESVQRGPGGVAMGATVVLDGQELILFNGGPDHTLSEAVSLFVNCETQAEIDDLWAKLSAGGSEDRCGWLKDKFGLSWQIVPPILGQYLSDPDPVKAQNVLQAMLKMGKLNIQGLKDAYNQK